MELEPRLLHRDPTRGYTPNPILAARGEPEALTADQQDLLTLRAHRTARQAQLDEWQQHRAQLQRTIDWLYSQRLRRNVNPELRILRRQLDRVDHKLTS